MHRRYSSFLTINYIFIVNTSMENILKWLNKYGLMLIVILLLIGAMQHCRQSSKLAGAIDAIEINNRKIDSLNSIISQYNYSDELPIMLNITGYQISKRMLYDNNAIIRTVTRPDDQMNQYDIEISKLTKELKIVQHNKLSKSD